MGRDADGAEPGALFGGDLLALLGLCNAFSQARKGFIRAVAAVLVSISTHTEEVLLHAHDPMRMFESVGMNKGTTSGAQQVI